jgi:glycosidase
VDPHFGTLADYKQLATALHKRGMKLVFDTVPNHVGPSHPWATDSPTPDWFHGTVASHRPPYYEFDRLVDPYATRLDRRDVIQGWFANVLPDMNTENPLVSEYLIQNAIWWIESTGIDAFRLDTFPYVGRAFWRDFHSRLHSVYPTLITFGETFSFDPRITSYFVGGTAREGINTGADSALDYPLAGAIRAVVQDSAPMTKVRDVLTQDWLYPHPERLITFIGNHDNSRVLNTDSADPARLKFGLGLLATLRGIPQLYVGDEIAMRGGEDPDNRRDFPGGFPGDTRSAFTAAGRTPQEQDIHTYVTGLMKYHHAHPLLRGGLLENLFVDDSAYLFARVSDRAHGCSAADSAERLLVAANKSAQARDITFALDETALQGCSSFKPSFGTAQAAKSSGGKVTFHLAPQSVVVYSVR